MVNIVFLSRLFRKDKAEYILDCVRNDGNTYREYQESRDFITRGLVKDLEHQKEAMAEMDNIITMLEEKNGLTLSNQEYKYIENCVMINDDEKQKKFEDNVTLFLQNKPQFESFIKDITQILEIEFEYKTVGIF